MATWPDEVKFSKAYVWSRGLHFINTPDKQCNFDWDRDCHDKTYGKDFCVAGAIVNYTQRMLSSTTEVTFATCTGLHKPDCVKNSKCTWKWTGSWKTSCTSGSGPSPPDPKPTPGPSPSPKPYGPLGRQNEALRFITHFMGDIHQPLHDGWTSDKGGNTIKIEEEFDDEKKMNLHAVWDEGIIQKLEKDGDYKWDGYAARLVKDVQGSWADQAKTWASCLNTAQPDMKKCLTEIAQESLALDCKDAYYDDHGKLITQGEELDDEYFKTRAVVIDQRLAQGGVRLAALLKYIKNANAEQLPLIVV